MWAQMDVGSAGFASTALPAARAAESWPEKMASGKFQGEIDGFAQFGDGVHRGFACFAGEDGEKLAEVFLVKVGGAAQGCNAFG